MVRHLLRASPAGDAGTHTARARQRAAPARHLPYFQLRDALQAPGCAVCRLAEEAVHGYQRSLLHENVNDPEARAQIVRSGGFCHEHAWRLVEHRDLLGTAIIHRDLVARFRDQLRSAPSGVSAGREGRRRAPCPACATRDETTRTAVRVLRDFFGESDLRERFDASDGLCRRHFAQALQVWAGPADALIEAQAASLARLLQQLDELIRKQDYRFSHEPVGEERNSWLRAIAAVSGVDTDMLLRPRSKGLPPVKPAPGGGT